MTPDPSEVIVTTDDYDFRNVPGLSVYHRNFPEVRGEGGSVKDAAARLVELLSLTLDCAPSDWCRPVLERAIKDVRAFAKQIRPESVGPR